MLCIFILLRYSLILDQPILIEFKQNKLSKVFFINTNIRFVVVINFFNSILGIFVFNNNLSVAKVTYYLLNSNGLCNWCFLITTYENINN